MEPEFTVKLTKTETNQILAVLEQQPFKVVNHLIVKLLSQANPQDEEFQRAHQQKTGPRAVT